MVRAMLLSHVPEISWATTCMILRMPSTHLHASDVQLPAIADQSLMRFPRSFPMAVESPLVMSTASCDRCEAQSVASIKIWTASSAYLTSAHFMAAAMASSLVCTSFTAHPLMLVERAERAPFRDTSADE